MVEIRELAELLALHKALMSARFADASADPVLLGSPYLARIHKSVLDEVEHAFRESGKPGLAHDWDEWRRLSPDRREWGVIRDRLTLPEMGWAAISDAAVKREVVELCLEPFRVTPAHIVKMIEEIDEGLGVDR